MEKKLVINVCTKVVFLSIFPSDRYELIFKLFIKKGYM